MDSNQFQALLDVLETSRKEHREDLGRVHDRLDKAMTEATTAAIQSAAFQATTNIELKNIGGRFDIQNGRLYKAEQDLLALKARESFSQGEIAMRMRLINGLKAVAGLLTKPWTYSFLIVSGSAVIAVTKL